MKLYTCVMCVGCGANLVGIYVNHNRFLFHHSFLHAFAEIQLHILHECFLGIVLCPFLSRRSCLVYKISNSFSVTNRALDCIGL